MPLYTPKNERTNWVYILTNYAKTVLYTGSTSDIVTRVDEHKAGKIAGFTQKYNVKYLVWYESVEDMDAALTREHRIKKWRRAWKEELINQMNPEWKDLYKQAKADMILVDF